MRAIRYDAMTQQLDAKFHDHAIYRYFDVPADVPAGLLRCPSKGGFFNREIRGRFRFVAICGPESFH